MERNGKNMRRGVLFYLLRAGLFGVGWGGCVGVFGGGEIVKGVVLLWQ